MDVSNNDLHNLSSYLLHMDTFEMFQLSMVNATKWMEYISWKISSCIIRKELKTIATHQKIRSQCNEYKKKTKNMKTVQQATSIRKKTT